MRRLPRHKLRNIMLMFFGTGAWGLVLGFMLPSMTPQPSSLPFYLTILGVVQLGLGGAFGWMYLTREPDNVGSKRRRHRKSR